MAVELPQSQVAALHHLATQLIDRRKPGSELASLARELLRGFYDVCWLAGLDSVLDGLREAYGLDAIDRTSLEEHEPVLSALVAQLEAIQLDGGGPRNAKVAQLADCVIAALALTAVPDLDRKLALAAEVRDEVVAAMAKVVEPEVARLREAIVEDARGRVEEGHQGAFTKLAAQLDDRGGKLLKLPKVPLDAQHAVERAFAEARVAVVERIVSAALDGAKVALDRADPQAAARVDAPVTTKATAREVIGRRVADARVPKTATAITAAIVEGLGELAQVTFRAAEKPVLPYAASRTFAVGDVIDHPKFGRGSVVAVTAQRIEVEFAESKATLVHGR